jgi:hypothetical protein
VSIEDRQSATIEDARATSHEVAAGAATSADVLSSPLLLVFVAAALVLPLWVVKYPPILDYPNHLARWFVIFHIHDSHYQFSQLYTVDWKPYPYILLDLVAVPMQYLSNIYIVGKLILTLCVLSVPFGTWFFLRRTNPENQYLALYAALMAYNPQFLMGSLQNEFSIGLCFVALGVWVTYTLSPSLAKWVLLSLLVTLIYLTHLIGFAVAGVAVTCFCLFARKPLRTLLFSWLLFVPGTICYILSQRNLPRGGPAYLTYTTLSGRLKDLAFPFRGYTTRLDILIIAVLVVCGLVMIIQDGRIRLNWCWAGTALGLVLLYFVVPSGVGETQGYINVRILLFAFIVALAALKSVRHKRLLIVAAAVLVTARCADVAYHFVGAQPQFRTVEAAIAHIPDQSRVLPVEAAWDGNVSLFLRPIHVYAYGVIDRGWLVPSLFHRPGVQSIRLKQVAYCPNEFCGPLNATEPDWSQVQRDYDYVWLSSSIQYREHLDGAGQLIFSEGRLSIYRMNGARLK